MKATTTMMMKKKLRRCQMRDRQREMSVVRAVTGTVEGRGTLVATRTAEGGRAVLRVATRNDASRTGGAVFRTAERLVRVGVKGGEGGRQTGKGDARLRHGRATDGAVDREAGLLALATAADGPPHQDSVGGRTHHGLRRVTAAVGQEVHHHATVGAPTTGKREAVAAAVAAEAEVVAGTAKASHHRRRRRTRNTSSSLRALVVVLVAVATRTLRARTLLGQQSRRLQSQR
jgi:hypothetical protein